MFHRKKPGWYTVDALRSAEGFPLMLLSTTQTVALFSQRQTDSFPPITKHILELYDLKRTYYERLMFSVFVNIHLVTVGFFSTVFSSLPRSCQHYVEAKSQAHELLCCWLHRSVQISTSAPSLRGQRI